MLSRVFLSPSLPGACRLGIAPPAALSSAAGRALLRTPAEAQHTAEEANQRHDSTQSASDKQLDGMTREQLGADSRRRRISAVAAE